MITRYGFVRFPIIGYELKRPVCATYFGNMHHIHIAYEFRLFLSCLFELLRSEHRWIVGLCDWKKVPDLTTSYNCIFFYTMI